MVQMMMMTSRPKVKLEAPDSCEFLHHLPKRPKLLSSPLEEPSPLGLRLNKTPSFLDLIQMRLSQSTLKTNKHVPDKLKASNFPASLLKIGSWEYKSRYEGDLVAKCYYAKHKLVWEMLDGGLKNKIEIQWSDIVAIKASYSDSDDGVDTLDVVLARQPLFFRELNPQPRKHTLWKATSDFTGAQASLHRRHFLQFSPGLLGKHFEKLVQCDPRLSFLSQQQEIFLDSPYFEPRVSVDDDLNEFAGLEIGVPATVPAAQTSSSTDELDLYSEGPDNICQPAPSPSAVMDRHAAEDLGSNGIKESEKDKGRTMRIHPSVSMSDLMNHIISQQMASGRDMRGENVQYLFSDSEPVSASDERIMSRVNSLFCLLQKDFTSDAAEVSVQSEDAAERKQLGMVSRKDSLGDLLVNLPSIACLPRRL